MNQQIEPQHRPAVYVLPGNEGNQPPPAGSTPPPVVDRITYAPPEPRPVSVAWAIAALIIFALILFFWR